jgi:hypothetical protein
MPIGDPASFELSLLRRRRSNPFSKIRRSADSHEIPFPLIRSNPSVSTSKDSQSCLTSLSCSNTWSANDKQGLLVVLFQPAQHSLDHIFYSCATTTWCPSFHSRQLTYTSGRLLPQPIQSVICSSPLVRSLCLGGQLGQGRSDPQKGLQAHLAHASTAKTYIREPFPSKLSIWVMHTQNKV